MNTKDILTLVLSTGALIVAIVSFVINLYFGRKDIRDAKGETEKARTEAKADARATKVDSRKEKLQAEIWDLQAFILSSEVTRAKRRIIESAEVIRQAKDDYSSESHDRSYLDDPSVQAAIDRGAAKDSDEFVDAYAVVSRIVSRAASIAPGDEDREIVAFWKKETVGLYGSIDDLMWNIGESRNELQKCNLLWPLDRATVELKTTLFSDEILRSQIEFLNTRRAENACPLTMPLSRYGVCDCGGSCCG